MGQKIKTLVLSDLHGYLPHDLPDHELLLICGDISPLAIQRNLQNMRYWMANYFIPWVESLSCKRCYMVWGNHDFIGQNGYKTQGKTRVLMDSGDEYKGLKIWGTSWCPVLKNWAFYGDTGLLKEKFSLIPENIDILLSHCAPDIDMYGTTIYGDDYGCEELTDAIERSRPRYCFFGHIHTGDHQPHVYNGITTLANCSIKDEDYNPTYHYQIFNIDGTSKQIK